VLGKVVFRWGRLKEEISSSTVITCSYEWSVNPNIQTKPLLIITLTRDNILWNTKLWIKSKNPLTPSVIRDSQNSLESTSAFLFRIC
jgi:hypothetical protein